MRAINVLWTSGWDSTFRVLDACATKGLAVQPHYIIDRHRPSHAIEVLTLCLLTQQILSRYPNARISAPLLTEKSQIPPDPAITGAVARLRKRNKLGDQYDYLARYAVTRNLTDLELCVHQQDKAHEFIASLAVPRDIDGETVHVVPPDDNDDALVFSKFRYPVLEMTKVEMEERAREQGFLDMLESTWFCHRPTLNGEPCGVCNPCKYAVEEGLARRLPERAMRRYRHRNGPGLWLWRQAQTVARRKGVWLGFA